MTVFFQAFTTEDIAQLFKNAQRAACYAGPGIRMTAAKALIETSRRLGPELITVCLDFDERVLRMGFGELDAVHALREAGIAINNAPGLRVGLAVADDVGYSFTPTALFLEAEDLGSRAMNAMRLSPDQAKEALARLSPAAKATAIVLATTDAERNHLSKIEVEVESQLVDESIIKSVESAIKEVPLTNFNVARQVRVYNARLQYVDLVLKNAAIERRRIPMPKSLQDLSGNEELEGRLRTTFDLIGKDSSLSSKPLTDKITKLRNDFTPKLGTKFGRAIIKSTKPDFEAMVDALRLELEVHQKNVQAHLEEKLAESRNAIVDHYEPFVVKNPPDAVRGRFGGNCRAWIDNQLESSFPKAALLVSKMVLELNYKDVTFETLNNDEFLVAAKKAFPSLDWKKAHVEYRAAREDVK